MREIALEDLDYALPPDRIAQSPVQPRDAAKLLVLDRSSGELLEHRFCDLPELVAPDDLLIVNDTRVIPARIRGVNETGGRVEALLTERAGADGWLALLRMRGRVRKGQRIEFGGARRWCAHVESVGESRVALLRFEAGCPQGADAAAIPDEIGEVPLPPYIVRRAPRAEDREDYQTVFARHAGSVAAPTASRHFTEELAARLALAPITLHVGPGTFRPIRCERLEAHRMEGERFEVPEATAAALARTRERGARVIAVGTTVVRALETTGGAAGRGRTDLFIRPGYLFRAIDSLITCFHLPRSSLLALVMAFAGVEATRRAYAFALEHDFRFYSYGDALWIR
jgi:S-adenosylmethionine:tRNA ribosyltransferase-isomerase